MEDTDEKKLNSINYHSEKYDAGGGRNSMPGSMPKTLEKLAKEFNEHCYSGHRPNCYFFKNYEAKEIQIDI